LTVINVLSNLKQNWQARVVLGAVEE